MHMNGEEKNIEMQGPFHSIRRQPGSFPTDNEPKRNDEFQSMASRWDTQQSFVAEYRTIPNRKQTDKAA